MKKLIVLFLLSSCNFTFCNDEWNAESYYQHSSVQRTIAEEILSMLVFDGTERILDIGCGDGKITASIAEKVLNGKVLGIDLSQVMIGFAQKNFANIDNLSFLIQDAHDLNYSTEFDMMVSFNVLQWIKEHEKVVSGFYKGLKEGGILGATMPLGLPAQLQAAVNEISNMEKWSCYFEDFSTGWNFVNTEMYRTILEQAGFTIDHFQIVRHNEAFETKEDFCGFISQFFPYLRPLPQELKSIFMNEVINLYVELEPLDEQGRLHFIFNRLDFIAHKK